MPGGHFKRKEMMNAIKNSLPDLSAIFISVCLSKSFVSDQAIN